MGIIMTLCVLTVVFTFNTSCKNKIKKTENNNVEIAIKVDTLCEKGKAIIEDSVSKYEGVVSVKAHLRKKIINVTYDSIKENKNKLVGTLEKLGFKTEFTKSGTIINCPCTDK